MPQKNKYPRTSFESSSKAFGIISRTKLYRTQPVHNSSRVHLPNRCDDKLKITRSVSGTRWFYLFDTTGGTASCSASRVFIDGFPRCSHRDRTRSAWVCLYVSTIWFGSRSVDFVAGTRRRITTRSRAFAVVKSRRSKQITDERTRCRLVPRRALLMCTYLHTRVCIRADRQ